MSNQPQEQPFAADLTQEAPAGKSFNKSEIIRDWQHFARELSNVLKCGTQDSELLDAAKMLTAALAAEREKVKMLVEALEKTVWRFVDIYEIAMFTKHAPRSRR